MKISIENASVGLVMFTVVLIAGFLGYYAYTKPEVDSEIRCLAKNIYFEAGIKGDTSKLAVGQVTRNRVNSDMFPNTYCGVVKQGYHKTNPKDPNKPIPIKGKCHFTWYCDEHTNDPYLGTNWHVSEYMAKMIYHDALRYRYDVTEGALWYHTVDVSPEWSKDKRPLVQIDNHLFFNNID